MARLNRSKRIEAAVKEVDIQQAAQEAKLSEQVDEKRETAEAAVQDGSDKEAER